MAKLVVGVNDLSSYCKANGLDYLLEEWDYQNNSGRTPESYTYGSKQSVFWKCRKCGASFQARIDARVRGNGCKKCGILKSIETRHRELLKNGSFAEEYPEIAAEWDNDLNGINTPNNFTKASHQKVYWKCTNGHPSYLASIANRVYGEKGCPICANRKILVGYNDLGTVYPFIASQWDYERNYPKTPQDVFPREANKYWWICPICNESYQATVSNRTAGKNHIKCAQKGTSFPEQAIFYYIKKQFNDAINRSNTFGFELDIYVQSANFAIEYDGSIYHKSDYSLQKDNKKDEACRSLGIKLYRVRPVSLPDTADAIRITCNDEKRFYDGFDECITKLFSYVLPEVSVDVNIKRDYYEIVSLLLQSQKEKSIVYTHPELAAQWHPTMNLPLTPDKVTSGMRVLAWWKCEKCGEVYQAYAYQRKRGSACPKCAVSIRASKRSVAAALNNNLAECYPELIEEIDVDLNPGIDITKLSAGSNKKIWWKCKKCGHIWETTINHRTRGYGCEICGRNRTSKAAERAVVNVDTGEVFSSLTAAAEFCGGDKRSICDCCRGKRKVAYGYHWEYKDPFAERKRHDGMLVKNVETGEIFNSIQEAADKYGCSRSSISSALRGETKTSQGYHWEWR